MASFVEYNPTAPAENYTNRSRGTDTPKGNDVLGQLFKGVGEAVDTTVKFVDNRNIQNLGEELTTGIDAIRGAQAVDAAVSDPTVTGGETGANVPGAVTSPPGVAAATSEISRIQQAYKEGKIGDTYYYSKVEALARQVRSKYPGYREEIDKKVSSIIGTNPANALRSSLLSDLKQAQSTAQSRTNSDEAIIERGKDRLSGAKYQRFVAGERDPAFIAELKTDIQQGEARKSTVDLMKSELELKRAQGTALKEDYEKIARKEGSDLVWNVINEGIDTAGGGKFSMNTINEKIAGLATGKALSPEELSQLNAGFNALENRATMAVEAIHRAKLGKNGEYSLGSELDQAQLNQAREYALAPLVRMRKALTDGDTGTFAFYANTAKMMRSTTTADMLNRSDTLRKLSAAQELLGPALTQALVDGKVYTKAVSEVTKVLNLDGTVSVLAGENMSDVMKRNIKESRVSGTAVNAREYASTQVTTTRDVLTNPKIDAKVKMQAAKSLFDQTKNFLMDKDLFTENSRTSVLATFTAPEVVDSMKELGKTDPAAWENYKSWVESTTKATHNTTLGTLLQLQTTPQAVKVLVDAQGRVSVERDRSVPTDQYSAASARQLQDLAPKIAQLNSAIDARRRSAKSDGMDPIAAGAQFVQALGLKLSDPKEGARSQSTAPLPDPAEGGAKVQPSSLQFEGVSDAILQENINDPNLPEVQKADYRAELAMRNGTAPQPEATIQLANSEDFEQNDRDLLIELERGPEAIDLEARDARRARGGYTPDPTWQRGGQTIEKTADLRSAIPAAAAELGVSAEDLATVISYETGGKFDPSIRGGAGNRHIGLIQFGPSEQRMYGASQDQTPGEQMQAVVKYLKHRGFKPGMGILDLYSTINAGSPGRYGASDANNGGAPGTVRDKVENQMAGHRARARRLLAD